MKVLGITGQVGAGKSTVLAWLQNHCGARVIQADKVGHLLMEPGMECYQPVVETFGKEILAADGCIDRKKLGGIVFADRRRLEQLNAIIHPAVKAWIFREIEKERGQGLVPFAVVEAALLLEEHYDQICDSIWYIYAEDAVRRKRLAISRGYTDEKIDHILKNQQKDNVFRELCHFVVDNSGDFVENTVGQLNRGLIEYGFL